MNTQWSRLLIWLFGGWLLMSGQAFADKYSKGLDAFRDEEYSKAYKLFSSVAKKSKDKSEKAEALVMMGAASAKMGKKSKAESLFNKALKADPDVTMSKDNVKDKSVRKLFAKTKKGGGKDEDEDDSGGDDSDEEKSDKSEKVSKSSGGGSALRAFVPFGLGFLFNGEVSKGLIYGGAQVAGIVGVLFFSGEIDKANADAKAVGDEALATGGEPPQETLDFLSQNEAFVKGAQTNQTVLAAVAVGGYGLSILDGLFFGGGGKSGKKSKRRAESLMLPLDHRLAETSSVLDTDTVEEAPRVWDMRLQLLPKREPGLLLSINRSF